MSYGNYGRYGSGYTPYGGSSRRSGSSFYSPSTYTRRPVGGPYGLTPSYSSSYISPNSSPRSSISAGSSRPSYSSLKTLTTEPDRSGYKLKTSKSASSIASDDSSFSLGEIERSPRYGSSSSVADSETSRSDTSSRYSSRVSLNDEDSKDYKKLYEEVKKENEHIKEVLKKTEDELERTKKQLQKLSQSSTMKNSLSETEKKERRTLERKLSEMEEEIKNISKLKTENEKLKAENRALSRVVCKLSK